MNEWRPAALVLSMLTVAACGGAGSRANNPTPTSPTSTVTSIEINGPQTIFIGSTAAFHASATLADGSTILPECAWTGDAPQTAAIDGGTGQVSGLRAGETTIACQANGVRSARRVRILPNYQGTWDGTYVVERCEQTQGLAASDFCSSFPRDRVLRLTARLTQDGDVVTGSFTLGTIDAQASSAAIDTDGTLRLSVAHVGSTVTIASTWIVNSERPGQMSGSMLQTWTSASSDRLRQGSGGPEGRIYARLLNTSRQQRPLLVAVVQ